jgi:RNA polymerase sigma-54 factor
LKAALQFRLATQLALTPQLQQSIRLLQLSTLELNQEIEQALADNPLLERLDDPLATSMRVAPDGSILTPGATHDAASDTDRAAPDGTDGAAPDNHDGTGSGDTIEVPASQEMEHDWGQGSRNSSGDDEAEPLAWAASSVTLREHLRSQLAATRAAPRDRALIEFLIEAINDDGYLDGTLEELLAICPAEAGIELDEITTALRLLQSFDPVGVGARSASECLGLQLAQLAGSAAPARAAPLGAPPGEQPPDAARVLAIAKDIVSNHLPLLAARDFGKLRRLVEASDIELAAAHKLIRGLNPRPGVGYGSSRTDYVVPDLFVRKIKGRWIAQLNPEVMPKLRLNPTYVAAVRRERGAWSTRLQEARWLIRNLQQRFETIQRVAQAIVERQSSFFTHGDIAMRPLVLREIADTVALHESTISRVTANKYVSTPFGVFELKHFFGSHVATETGGAASSTAIRALIRQLVGAENPRDPLSDSRIAELLGEQGIVVARRTVAKYRELLQIPPVAMRKVL